jgi:hypothetical protein
VKIAEQALGDQYRRAHAAWPFVDDIEQHYQLPRRLLWAVGSRETNLGAVYTEGRTGDGGHGHGVWQLDDRFHEIPAGFDRDARAQAEMAAKVLRGFLGEFPGNLMAGVCAYNAGAGGVRDQLRKGRDPNLATTGHDYGTDVLARMRFLQTVASPSPTPTPVPAPETEEIEVQIVKTTKTAFLAAAAAGIDAPPNAGYELHADGGIDNINGAPFYGGYFNKPESVWKPPQPERTFLTVTPRNDGLPGYVIWGVDGTFYAFGPDLWHPDTQAAD